MKLSPATLPMTRDQAREIAARPERKKTSPLDAAQRALSEAFLAGDHIVHLGDTIRAGGHYDSGMPKLAVGLFGWLKVMINTTNHRQVESAGRWRNCDGSLAFEQRITVPPAPGYVAPKGLRMNSLWSPFSIFAIANEEAETATEVAAQAREPQLSYIAPVPVVPDRCRPDKTKGRDLAIIFETEWTPVIKADPALIERIAGPYWRVLASWDLTPLEAEIMSKMAYQG